MTKTDKALQKVVKAWSFKESVVIAKHCWSMSQKYSLDLVRELHAANEALSNSGYRSDLTSCQMAQGSEVNAGERSCMTSSHDENRFHTFDEYLSEVGIAKRTAYRWLALYDSDKDILLSMEEFKARKLLEFEELIKQLEASVGKPIDWRPDGWSTACENYYNTKLKQRKLLEIAQRNSFDQAELFNREYLASLSDRFDVASPQEILEFGRLCEDLKPYAAKEVPVPKQVRVVKLVEAALSEFQPAVREKVAKFVAETIIRMEVK